MAGAITIKFNTKEARGSVEAFTRREIARFKKSTEAVAKSLQRDIKKAADQNIREAGNFGRRWTKALNVTATPSRGGFTVNMFFDQSIPYAMIHQTGGLIRGEMWIPLSFSDARNRPPREYPGKLFTVRSRTGKVFLFSANDRRPKYVFKNFVRVPKSFELKETAQEVVTKNIQRLFAYHYPRTQ